MDKKPLKALVRLEVAVMRRNWEEVEKEVDNLTAIILAEYTKPVVRERIIEPVFSAGYTRYAGNSGFSGGCMRAAA